jgi:hypothetical protein
MSQIVKHNETQVTVAKAMGLSLSRFNAKINEREGAEFTQGEIQFLIDRYQLTADAVKAIFFCSQGILSEDTQ